MILFLHNKIFGRDGVSLEISKRVAELEAMGEKVGYITGDTCGHDDGLPTVVIPELALDAPEIATLRTEMFYQATNTSEYLEPVYEALEKLIFNQYLQAFSQLQPRLVFVHNMFSNAYNLPATTALIKALDYLEIPTVAVNHDFWFERTRFLKPKHRFVERILKVLPPKRSYILEQQVINSLAEQELWQRRQIRATRIGDYFDFTATPPGIDDFNRDLRTEFGIGEQDLLVLQATRITQRKAIEIAIEYVARLESVLVQQTPVTVNGRQFQSDSRVVLFLPNFVEVDDDAYADRLRQLAKSRGVKMVWASDRFGVERSYSAKNKQYRFWDAYVHADLVTYPSIWEGFGNQFLEAVFFRKLPAVFEYPVFAKDIKPEGYEFVSLGQTSQFVDGLYQVESGQITQAVNETVEWLADSARLEALTSANLAIAGKYHGTDQLRTSLERLLGGVAPDFIPTSDLPLNGSCYAL